MKKLLIFLLFLSLQGFSQIVRTLPNVDNVADINKPVSTPQKAYIDLRLYNATSKTDLAAFTDADIANYDGSVWERKSGNVASNGGSYAGTIINVSSSFYWSRICYDLYNVKWFGAKGDGVTDDTEKIQNTIDFVNNNQGVVLVPNGYYKILGTIFLRSGVAMRGESNTGQYYQNQIGTAKGSIFFKPDDISATNNSIIEVGWSSGLSNIELRSYKKGTAGNTGILRMGSISNNVNLLYVNISNVQISGVKNNTRDPALAVCGIYFPANISGFARYFNKFNNVTVTDCDIAIYLSGQSNGNVFTNISTRECSVHYYLDSSVSECIENSFTGLGLFSIIGNSDLAFKLTANTRNNIFTGYVTELYGKEFEVDELATGNYFLGSSNEALPSFTQNNIREFGDKRYTGFGSERLVNRTTDDRHIYGFGAKMSFLKNVSGVLPFLGNNTGTLDTSPSSKKIITFNTANYKKTGNCSFFAKLRLFATGPFDLGCQMVEVDFVIRVNETTTDGTELIVTNFKKHSAFISGLHFIHNGTNDGNYSIALCGGSYGSAYNFGTLTASLEIEAVTFNNNVTSFENFENIIFVSNPVISTDVSNSASLLTIATTTF
jgi:hypothetical protein